jgi:hypothetical protein
VLQVLLLAAAVWLTTHAANGLSTAAAALTFALFLQQCAFAGHDTAHNGITHGRLSLSLPLSHSLSLSLSISLCLSVSPSLWITLTLHV